MAEQAESNERAALILSGGGMRGAYAVGVVAGLVDVLGLHEHDVAPFQIFTGTSVGAINAGFLASHAHSGTMHIDRLIGLWTSLELTVHLRLELLERIRDPRKVLRLGPLAVDSRLGASVLDVTPLEHLISTGLDWSMLRHNIDSGRVAALIITALEIASGRTTMFADLAPGTRFATSHDPRRVSRRVPVNLSHILASAAIPALFPARRIGDAFYCDGGLRFNTPIAPAIRAGATRLVVVPLLRQSRRRPVPAFAAGEYPGLTFLAGKLLNALLADPVDYDLQVLERFNALIEVLESTLDGDDYERVQSVLMEGRGARYRHLVPLVIRPSQDIGVLAGDYLRATKPGRRIGGPEGWLLRYLRWRTHTPEADWASYVLFDGGFAQQLIELGHQDAHAQRDEILRFFAP